MDPMSRPGRVTCTCKLQRSWTGHPPHLKRRCDSKKKGTKHCVNSSTCRSCSCTSAWQSKETARAHPELLDPRGYRAHQVTIKDWVVILPPMPGIYHAWSSFLNGIRSNTCRHRCGHIRKTNINFPRVAAVLPKVIQLPPVRRGQTFARLTFVVWLVLPAKTQFSAGPY